MRNVHPADAVGEHRIAGTAAVSFGLFAIDGAIIELGIVNATAILCIVAGDCAVYCISTKSNAKNGVTSSPILVPLP